MVYVFEVSLIHSVKKTPLATYVECITAKDPDAARVELEKVVPSGWEINKLTLVGSRKK